MTLIPGCRLAVAPHFHMPVDWSRRITVADGADDPRGGFVPRPLWRSATCDEIALLTSDSGAPTTSAEICASLFHLSGYLHTAWWTLLERAAGVRESGTLPGIDVFVREVGEFLTFKGLPVPDKARADVVFNDYRNGPEYWSRESIHSEGMICKMVSTTTWPWTKGDHLPRLWGGINLAHNEISLVLVNLTCRQLDL